MKKSLLSLSLLGVCIISNAQVGVGTNDPKATLEVKKSTTTPTTSVDGIIPPNITKTELANKVANTYTAVQTGALVYVSDATGGASGTSLAQVAQITTIGYYTFNGTVWTKLLNATDADTTNDAWINNAANTRVELGTLSTGAARTGGTEVVMTDTGRVGIKTTTPAASLEVKKSTTTPTTSVDGVIPPNMTKTELANKASGTYAAAQAGAMVYVTDPSGGTSGASLAQVSNIQGKGYYYYDSVTDKWVLFADMNNISLPVRYGTITAATATSTFTVNSANNGARNLGSNIVLPPGKWLVEIGIILDVGSARNNSYTWIKFSFTDNTAATNITQSSDFVGANKLISGALTTTADTTGADTNPFYGFVSGKVLLNNTTQNNKTYTLLYYGNVQKGAIRTVTNLGSDSFGENYISAMKIQ